MRSVAVTNAKGGVGKSTTAINLASCLADLGRRVLLIDADPSGNAALGFLPSGLPSAGLADLLLDEAELEEVLVPTGVEGLDLVPPGDRLGSCSDQMGGSQGLGQGREFRIRRILRRVPDHEVVILDTSPVQTPLNVAILYAVGEVVIPIDPCVAALAGVKTLEGLIREVGALRQEFTDAGPLVLTGVLITRVDRTLVARQIEAEVRDYFGPLAFERSVPTSVRFREAYARGIPLVRYDPYGLGSRAYQAAAEAFLIRGGDPVESDRPRPLETDDQDNEPSRDEAPDEDRSDGRPPGEGGRLVAPGVRPAGADGQRRKSRGES